MASNINPETVEKTKKQTFIEFLKSVDEEKSAETDWLFDGDVIVGGEDMEYALVWEWGADISEYGYEKYKALFDSEYEITVLHGNNREGERYVKRGGGGERANHKNTRTLNLKPDRKQGYTLQKHGAELYVKEYPGLCLNELTGEWYNHYESVGGRNAVDCLVKACGHNFKQAVYELTGKDVGEKRSTDYPKNQAPQYTSPSNFTAPKEKNEPAYPLD